MAKKKQKQKQKHKHKRNAPVAAQAPGASAVRLELIGETKRITNNTQLTFLI